MEVNIVLEGKNANEISLLALEDWIIREKILGIQQINRFHGKPQKNEMGVGFFTIITVVLGSKALVELIKCLNTWIKTTRSKELIIKIKTDNYEVEINGKNIPNLERFLE